MSEKSQYKIDFALSIKDTQNKYFLSHSVEYNTFIKMLPKDSYRYIDARRILVKPLKKEDIYLLSKKCYKEFIRLGGKNDRSNNWDVIGSFYEGKIKKAKSKNFELFTPYSICTDDTIMTIAVGQALVNTYQEKEISIIQKELIKEMQRLGKIYPYSRYGKQFSHWLREEKP